jgi:glutamyl-tRNA synthetase
VAAALNDNAKTHLRALITTLENLGPDDWHAIGLETIVKQYLKDNNIKLGDIGPALRAALTGTLHSPALFEVMEVLGKEEVKGRIQKAA